MKIPISASFICVFVFYKDLDLIIKSIRIQGVISLREVIMTADRVLSPSMLEASKKAASYEYDKSQYIVVNMNIRRDAETGRLISKNGEK